MSNSVAQKFRDMADLIERNEAVFAGAAVIVPPAEGGDPVEVLILDKAASAAQFWATVGARSKESVEAVDARKNNPFGVAR